MTRALLILISAFQLLSLSALGAWLEWDASPDAERVAGYRVYHGSAVRSYDAVVDVGTNLSWNLASLPGGRDYFFAVTAYDAEGLESDFSEELKWRKKPSPPITLRITTPPPMLQASTNLSDWYDVFAITNLIEFFRVP